MRCATALAVIIRRFLDLTLSTLTQFTLEIYAAATNCKKTLKPLFLKFKVIDVYTNKKLVTILPVMISRMSLPICNRFQATRANSGKITTCRFLKMYVLC